MSAPVPLITGTVLSYNSGILSSEGNPVSHVRADGNENMSAVLTDWKPWSGLGFDSCDTFPETLEEQTSFASFPY